jgi:hypothetical protein
MTEEGTPQGLRDRLRWWLYEKCFAYCVRCVHPDADPNEFTLLDTVGFLAVERDEMREIMEEAPEIAWRFVNRMEETR